MSNAHVPDFPSRIHRIGDIDLNVIDVGSGPAVLLLHGFPDRAQMWKHQIKALSEAGYRVVAPDLRGFGDSSRPSEVEAYGASHLLGDIQGLLAELGVEDFYLAAHDWGANLGWILAGSLSERVKKYAAFSVGHPRAYAGAGFDQKQLSWYVLLFQFPGVAEQLMPREDWQWYRDWIHNGAARSEDADLNRQIADLSRDGALTSGLNWYRANLGAEDFAESDWHALADLPPIACPVMGVWSEREPALTERQMTDSSRFVAGEWRYERIPHVGHWIPAHAPAKTSALLLDFFGDLSA